MNVFLKMNLLRESTYKERIKRQYPTDISNCLNLPDSYFLKNTGVNRAVFYQILRILEPVVPKTQRSNGIPFPLKVLVTLSFLANGSHQKSVGKDFNVCISQKSVSRIINIIVEGFNLVLDDWVVFPSTVMQRQQSKEGFYSKYHFPETIGCLDGTYVEIVCPRDDEEAFYDKKGQYSIHAQLMTSRKEKKERLYGQGTLEEAVRMVQDKEISLYQASTQFKIPKGKIHGTMPLLCKKGPQTLLSKDEEYQVATWILNMAKVRYPVSTDDVRDTVGQFFEGKGQSNIKPGKKWMRLFLNRHPDITKRHAEICV